MGTEPGKIYLKFVLMRIRQAAAMAILGLAPALTGCLTHTRIVPKTRPADVVLNAELVDLLKQVDLRFSAVQTMNASIDIVATTGGGRQGKETQYPSFAGYIFLRKPQDLRVLLRVPLSRFGRTRHGQRRQDLETLGPPTESGHDRYQRGH